MSSPLNILFIFKRYYMGKDVLADRYGRLFQFPFYLAKSGHKVTCLLTDYHFRSGVVGPLEQDGVTWISAPVSRAGKLLDHVRRMAWNTDVIIGSSDCLQVCLAAHLAKKYSRPYVLDLYDNYESFGLSRIPFVRSRYRKSLREADAITCVGDELKELVQFAYAPRGILATLNSTISGGQFYPVEKSRAREELSLPGGDILVGVCGGLTRNRGIEHFYRAVVELWAEGMNFKLVLAGSVDEAVPPPPGENTILLGNLAFDQMNWFYNALDLNVLQYMDNDFGRYAYPQKLEEIVSTRVPLVAADVGALRQRFATTPSLLYKPDDTSSIKQAIARQLVEPCPYDYRTQTWESVVVRLEELLFALTQGNA